MCVCVCLCSAFGDAHNPGHDRDAASSPSRASAFVRTPCPKIEKNSADLAAISSNNRQPARTLACSRVSKERRRRRFEEINSDDINNAYVRAGQREPERRVCVRMRITRALGKCEIQKCCADVFFVLCAIMHAHVPTDLSPNRTREHTHAQQRCSSVRCIL